MSLTEEFHRNISHHNLFKATEQLLVAVSGGLDSVVLVHLLRAHHFRFSIAHCNFQLRGEESNKDAQFVKNLASSMDCPYYEKTFEVEALAKEQGISIQMAARELRYQWFDALVKSSKSKYVLTAHHADDSVETVLINLLRGTGIDGMKGITAINGIIRRPLLFATKEEIRVHAKEKKIKWREDSSNLSDDYTRNFIRRKIIPHFTQLNPSFIRHSAVSISKLHYAGAHFDKAINILRKSKVKKNGDIKEISIKSLPKEPHRITELYYLLQDFGINWTQAEQLAAVTQAGKIFNTPAHTISRDRTKILIAQRKAGKDDQQGWIGQDVNTVQFGNDILTFAITKDFSGYKKSAGDTACLDFEKLQFPMAIRRWKQGDYFYPLGMKGKKKISDFLIDQKIPVQMKKDVLVLESDGKIAWLVGHRLDDRFKISVQTKTAFIVNLASS